jgi:hypothetical protein
MAKLPELDIVSIQMGLRLPDLQRPRAFLKLHLE